MANVKVFKFEVSNQTSSPIDGDERSAWFIEAASRIASQEHIDNALNAFLRNIKLISMHTNTIDVKYHNNARGNTIWLVYTIVYETKGLEERVPIKEQRHDNWYDYDSDEDYKYC